MNRWLALAIAVIGDGFLGYAMLLVIGGGILGFLWLFVFGDDPWPAWSDYVVGAPIVIGGFTAWTFCSRAIWRGLKPNL